MTRIDFYTNADSRLQVTCRLIEKALSQKLAVTIYTPDDEIAKAIDKLLWTNRATSFVPHCFADSRIAAMTPVLLARELNNSGPDDLLINLGEDCPGAFARFRRLMEIVGRDESDRNAARGRWRHYKERGYEINHVDLGSEK